MKRFVLMVLCWLASPAVIAQIAVVDDSGVLVKLTAPAQRIVSLAPHATELLFAAGAGTRVVGVMEGSDYPPDARRVPRVGGPSAIDIEAVLALRPDLVVAWHSGNPPAQLAKLRALGLIIFMSEPRRLADIPSAIQRLGMLAGTQPRAQSAIDHFQKRLAALPRAAPGVPPVRVFYQIWQSPLITVNDSHIISDVLRTCQAENVFGSQSVLTPAVSMEAVIAANPELMVNTRATRPDEPDWRAPWRPWRHLTVNARDNFCEVTADWMSRAGPRMIDGAEELCDCINQARQKRQVSAPPAPRR